MLYQELHTCRSCYSKEIETILDLGMLPISDFPSKPGQATLAPLEVGICTQCSLVQLRHTVSRDLLYKGQYWYRSGTNESMVQALKDVVEDVSKYTTLQVDDYVLDIGCNDGTLLSFYPRWVWGQGFEPAKVMAKEAVAKGHARVFNSYFPPPWRIETQYKVITSIAQFYNVERLNSYVRTIAGILHPTGVWCIQMAHLPDTLASNNVGDFCHEHLTFWTINALALLLQKHSLHIVALSFNDTNGGSFRVMVKHGSGIGVAVEEQLDLSGFLCRVERLKETTVQLLTDLRDSGKKVIGLGASTKNNTVLSWYGVGPDLIPYFADRQEAKHGRYTVTDIPIISEEVARAMEPDFYFVGPYHFLDSLMLREKDFMNQGGKFIVPFPELHIAGLGLVFPEGRVHHKEV